MENLLRECREQVSISIVTDNTKQASRISNYCAVMTASWKRTGRPVERDENDQVFGDPRDPCTEAYVTGRIGQDERNQHAS
jgi:phosphate transport system ATP-binding protein